jgi:hypothetical protein
MADPDSLLDVTFKVRPGITSSIKSVDTIAVFGASVPIELPLAMFQVVMAFAETTTARQVFQSLDMDVDLAGFTSIVRHLSECGVLVRAASPDEQGNLRQSLGHGVLEDPSLGAELAAAMQAGRAVVIPDALPPALAERVHQELDQSSRWWVDEGGHDFFHYRNSVIDQLEVQGGALAECKRLFTSAATQRFIAEISGQDCSGPALAAAAWYRPGDYALPHSDSATHVSRTVAYIWYVTKNWRREWGGSLFWCPTGQYVSPGFNVLVMFNAFPSNMHCVCPVAPTATAKRLTINGFWHHAPRSPALPISVPESTISLQTYGPRAEPPRGRLPIVVL